VEDSGESALESAATRGTSPGTQQRAGPALAEERVGCRIPLFERKQVFLFAMLFDLLLNVLFKRAGEDNLSRVTRAKKLDSVPGITSPTL
jgi:hypothetical protein